ncbi:MAG: hypothetical protein KF768_07985 [Phycisphaeraceae bacterium]|nr:hypothetical protein [Phycisphaeraceae bacterium]
MNRPMRTVRTSCLIAGLTLVVAGGSPLVGCQSQKDRAARATVRSVGDFQRQLQEMPAHIDATMNQLIATTSGQNPRRADDFREFQKGLESMRGQARLVASEYDRASRDSSEYFRQWMRESNRAPASERAAIDADIARNASNREIALGHFNSARRDYNRLINTLNDVETSIAKDMSEKNVLAMGDNVARAITDAGSLRDQIARLEESIAAALMRKN